jgi:hypothetical protein
MTFPVSAEIVCSGLVITLNNGEKEFHPSDPMPAPRKAKRVRDGPRKSNDAGPDAI